jgi:hypothetical protein
MAGTTSRWGRTAPGKSADGQQGGSTFLGLVRCWAVAIVVQQLLQWAFTVSLFEPLATQERLESFTWRLLLLHIPALVGFGAATFSAARVHKEPGRASVPLHLLATLTVPVTTWAIGLATTWGTVNAEGVGMPLAALCTGAAAALGVDRMKSGRDEDRSPFGAVPVRRTGGFRARGDRGATASEYLGVIVVVTALITAVSGTQLGERIGSGLKCQIMKVTVGGTCGDGGAHAAPKTDADYEPALCRVSTVSDKAGAEVKLGFFTLGDEYGFRQQVKQSKRDENGDGEVNEDDKLVYMTFTHAGSVGAEATAGKLKLGDYGEGEVSIGGGIEVTNGDTWVFKSEEEAQKFRDDIEEMKTWEASMQYSGGGGNIYAANKWAEKHEEISEKLGDQHITYGSGSVYGTAAAGIDVKAGDEDWLSGELGGDVTIAPKVMSATDNRLGNRSYTYSVQFDGKLAAGVEAGGVSEGKAAHVTRSGSITVTRDQETGELVRIDMTQITETGATSSQTSGGDGKNKGSVNDPSGPSDIDVRTNTLYFGKGDDPATRKNRQVAEEWLEGSGDNTTPFEYLITHDAPTEAPEGGSEFDRLMFDEGKSSKMKYDAVTDAKEFGAELSLGIGLGFNVSFESKEQNIREAEFLGAPDSGARSYVPYSYCAE